MKLWFNCRCFPILLLFCGLIICENIHLPLDNLFSQKLIESTHSGPVEIITRGEGKALRFNGTNGPVSITYTLDQATDAISSCFRGFSHCTDYIIKFWVKLNLESPIITHQSFIKFGPSNDSQKGLSIYPISESKLSISYDNWKEKQTIELAIAKNEWNFIKIFYQNSKFSAESNEIKSPSLSERSKLNNFDLSQESLVLGFEKKSNGIVVELDDFKFQFTKTSNDYQSDSIQSEESYETKSSIQERSISFNGQNYLKYNFENRIIRPSDNEELDLQFKFSEDFTSGLLWYAEKGLEKSYIYLKDSRLYYAYIYRKSGGGAQITATEEIYVPEILSPNTYHRLVIHRTSDKLTLTINKVLKANKAIIVGRVPLIPVNGHIYVGGHEDSKVATEGRVDTRFRGSIKNVTVTGENHESFDLINIFRDKSSISIVKNFGDVTFTEKGSYDYTHTGDYLISATPVPFTFTDFDKFVRFSPWDFKQFESIEMQFRTKEPKGVLLFVGPDNAHTDYVCLEFYDRNLYLAFGIDGKDYRKQMNPKGTFVTTGNFHTIFIKRDRNHKFTAKFDDVAIDIGEQSGHQREFGSFTYIGGIDNPSRPPWYVWSREGFVGCINYMRINEDKYIDPRGKNNQYSGDIAGVDIGKCLNDVRHCTASHCEGGVCHDRSYPYLSDKNFYCDCSAISRTYRNPVGNIEREEICARKSEEITSDGTSFYVVDFKSEDSRDKMMKTHTDDIAISFNTAQSDATIFQTFRSNSDLYFSVKLVGGYVVLETNINDKDNSGVKQTFRVPIGNLNDNKWHTIYIKRRAEHILVYVDNVNNQIIGKIPVLKYLRTFDNTFEYIFVGSDNFEADKQKFVGSIRNFYWNQFDFLGTRRLAGTYTGTIKTPKPSLPPLPPYPRDPPVKCTMRPDHRYTKVTDISATQDEIGIYIEFRTKYNGIIWHGYDTYNSGGNYMTLMLIDNKLILVYHINEVKNVNIIEDGSQLQLNDNNWHRVVITLNKKLRRIIAHVDKGYHPRVINLPVVKSIEISKLEFYFGGMPEDLFTNVFTQLRVSLPFFAEKVATPNAWSLVGCLGEFLMSEDKFLSNKLSGAINTYPLNSLDCGGCRNPLKCENGYCLNSGRCYQLAIDKLGCNCTEGFTGENCEKIEFTCPRDFCRNGGRCYMFDKQPKCDCSGTGFRGSNCEQSFCSESYCQNNGVCSIKDGLPSCDCRATQHMGKICEKPICLESFCNNRGRCYVSNEQPICDCTATGFIGKNCEREICPSNFCKNGGLCIPRDSLPTCQCTPEFTGYKCTDRKCSDNYCYNGGICYISNDRPQCSCNKNFEGQRCEIEKRCPLDYCFYGGVCQLRNGYPYCDCLNTNYEGARCNIPKICPAEFCSNGGNCQVRNGQYYCECGEGFQGSRCQEKKECPPNFCKNDGICSVVNNGFTCDCTHTGYFGYSCSEKVTGFKNEYDKYGFVIYPINPPVGTTNDQVTVGFQTFMKTGTIYTFKTANGKYWSLKMDNGKLVIDINGNIYRTQSNVNDGQYYVVSIKKEGERGFFKLMGPQSETFLISFDGVTTGNQNEILYKEIIIGANNEETDIFKGAIGGFNWNGKYIFEQIKSGQGERKGTIEIILVPTIISQPSTSCPKNFCFNNAECIIMDYIPYCKCENTGYFGQRCEKRTYGIFPKENSYGGYLVMNINPPKQTNKDETQFLLQAYTSNNPVIRYELSNGQFYEINMIDGKLIFLENGEFATIISDKQRMDNGNPYLVKFIREKGTIKFYINGIHTSSVNLRNILENDGSLTHKRIILGTDRSYKTYFQGALGGFEWNGYKMIDNSGKLLPEVTKSGEVIIILMPNLTRKITLPKKIKPLPDLVPAGNHGGIVTNHNELYVPGVGSGGGAIVPVGTGPVILGAGSLLGLPVVYPLGVGLFLATLLLLSALLWACWRCKPGCCPCCTGFVPGKTSAAALKHKILTPMQLSSVKTGGAGFGGAGSGGAGFGGAGSGGAGKTGEKSFWSRMKSGFTTPITHNIYESNGYKSENIGLLSANANGMAHGDHGDFHSTTIREDRGNITKNIGGSMQSLPGGPLLYSGTQNMRSTRSVTGGASYGHNYGHGNMLDVSDRFGTIGQGSIMRIDTTHHETDFEGRPNVFAGEEMKVDCCVLSQNSRYAVTGSANSPPQIWDMQTGELYKVMDGMEIGCTDLHLACGDKILVGLVMDEMPTEATDHHRLKRLQMWDFMTGSQIGMPLDVMCSASCITHSSDHMIINREYPDGGMSIVCWDLQANQPVQEIHYQTPDFMNHEGITFLKISHNDRMVVAGFTGMDDQAHYMVFDLMASYPNGIMVQPLMSSFNAKTCATEIIGADEAITGTRKGELIIWNLRTAKPVRQILIQATLEGNTQTKLNPHKDAINCIAISKNGEYLVTGSADQTVNVYTMADERLMHTLEGHADDVLSAVISLDNEIIVSGSWDGSMRVWNLESGSQMCWFTSNIEILSVKLTNDKKAIVALGERMGLRKLIMLQIIRNRTRRTRHTGGAIGSPPFSPIST